VRRVRLEIAERLGPAATARSAPGPTGYDDGAPAATGQGGPRPETSPQG
jgi:hypothetical protein